MNKQRKILTVTGKTGRGKSYFTENYLAQKIAGDMPVIIADSMAEYNRGLQFKKGFQHFYDHVKQAGFKNEVHIVPIRSDSEAVKLFAFSRFCGVPHCLVVEEASKYCSPYQIDERLNDLVRYGRHWGVSLVFSAQRFAQLNKIITSQTDHFITFQQTEKNDLKAISDFFNGIEKIRALNKRQFVAFGDDSGISEIITNEVLTLKNQKLVKV